MARTELAKVRSPIGDVKTFVAASGTYTAGTILVVNDLLVYPLETASSATAVVAYEIPNVVVAKETGQIWLTGHRVYWRVDTSEFTNEEVNDSQTPTGIVIEGADSGDTEGNIHFFGAQFPAPTLDTNPSA